MGTSIMGRLVVAAKIENLADINVVESGVKLPDSVRTIEIPDALVDTGSTSLSMPKRYIEQLGLKFRRTRQARTAGGIREFGVYSAVRLTIQERDCVVEVSELPDDCPVLIGQIPLEAMDWVVDPNSQRLIGNPAHGGQWAIEVF